MSLKSAFEDLQDVLSAAPELLTVIPVPEMPPLVEHWHLPATVDAKQLKAATDSGLPLVLAAHIDPKNDSPRASDLQPLAVRAKVFFTGPDCDGKTAVIFETAEMVRVKYSDNNGQVLATARPDNFWEI